MKTKSNFDKNMDLYDYTFKMIDNIFKRINKVDVKVIDTKWYSKLVDFLDRLKESSFYEDHDTYGKKWKVLTQEIIDFGDSVMAKLNSKIV